MRPRAAVDELVVAATRSAAAGFLTLMVPTASGATAPDFAATRPAEGITSLRGAAGDTTVLVVLNTTGAAWQGVDADGQAVPVPAESSWVRTRTTSGQGDDGPWTTRDLAMVKPPFATTVDPLFEEGEPQAVTRHDYASGMQRVAPTASQAGASLACAASFTRKFPDNRNTTSIGTSHARMRRHAARSLIGLWTL